MQVFAAPDFADHEQVVFACDPAAGLRAIIAVHSTVLGPALGGCRIWPYESEAAALTDVLRLSRGMTYKAAMAGLPFGGGKMVVIADPRRDKTPALLAAVGRAIERLAGRYSTGEDVGTTVEDMAEIRKTTSGVFGLPEHLGGSGDPSPSTALGCFAGIKACVEHKLGRAELTGITVAVQGLGNVGWRLAALLADAGAKLTVTDARRELAEKAARELGAQVIAPDAIYGTEAEVFAPCALGAVLQAGTLPRLKARIVAGAANNQLAQDADAGRLAERGILYAPDYVINGGGMIQLAAEHTGLAREKVRQQILGIGDTLRRIFTLAEAQRLSTLEAANRLAEARFLARSAA